MSRREDFRLVVGEGRYTSDWNLEGQLHAAFLRADRAHAEIVRLDAARALAHPGVRAVLTGEDAREAGFKSLPNIVTYPGKAGQQLKKPHHPVLAMERVRFVGEPVAMVVADTAALAEDARELIDIEYRDLPAVATFDAAVRAGAPQLHHDVPGNLAFEYESGDEPAVAAAFARAKHVSKVTMESQRLVGNMLEPRACLVAFDPASGRYTIHAPMQGVNSMRGQVMQVTGLDQDRITLVAQDVGGSFGVHGAAYPEYFAAMIAARKLGRPVKWIGTRSEVFMSDFHGRAISLTGELALDADGKFLAIRFDDRADLGAYGGTFGSFIATRNLTITMGGVYRIPALYARTRLAYTNTVPVSAYRGAGRPDIAYAIERLVDYTASEHGFDPVELRRKNLIPPEAMPYKTPNAGTYDSGDFEGVMDDALERAGWSGFPARRAAAQRAGKLRGIGIATYLEAGGGGAVPKDQVAAEFDRNGAMTLFALTQSSGQGHETVFPQIVAGALGIDTKHVRFHPRPPAADLIGNATGGSRGVLGTGSAFRVLGEKLIELARPHAAARLKVPQSGLTYSKGKFHAGPPLARLHRARARARRTEATSARHHRRRHLRRHLPERLPHRRGRDRPRHRRRDRRALHCSGRSRQRHQPHAGRRPGSRRRRAGGGTSLRRAGGIRHRHRAAADRQLHGLFHAARGLDARHWGVRPLGALAQQRARREGRGRSRLHRLASRAGQRHPGRAASARDHASRHAPDARPAVGGHAPGASRGG